MVDQVYMDAFNVPNEVRPNAAVTATVQMRHTYQFINPGDINSCVYHGDVVAGIMVYVEIDTHDGTRLVTSEDFCINDYNTPVSHNITFKAPAEEGEYTLSALSRFAGDDTVNAGQVDTITVSKDAPSTGDCFSDENCPDGQRCKDGTCVDATEPDNPLGSIAQFLEDLPTILLFILIILALKIVNDWTT